MNFKNEEDVQKDAKIIGMGIISKLSAINYLSATKMGIDFLITFESQIIEIECGLWSLVPLAINGRKEIYHQHLEHIQNKINTLLAAIKTIGALNG